jgi:hypothetical protein
VRPDKAAFVAECAPASREAVSEDGPSMAVEQPSRHRADVVVRQEPAIDRSDHQLARVSRLA